LQQAEFCSIWAQSYSFFLTQPKNARERMLFVRAWHGFLGGFWLLGVVFFNINNKSFCFALLGCTDGA
jgi:hypothetical protein